MRRVLTLTAVAVLVLAGCTDDDPEVGQGTPATTDGSPDGASPEGPDGGSPSPTGPDGGTGSPTDPSPATTGADEQPFPANTERDTSEASGEAVVVTDIEIARNQGFDRVVLSIGGDGTPGWLAEYVERAEQQGSGHEVEVEGEAILALDLRGMAYPTDSESSAYDGEERRHPQDTEVIREVRYGSTFEGHTQIWIGVSDELPFRVVSVDDPTRVVIDVVHPDRVE